MSIVIKAENLSKAYQLGQFGTGTLSRDIERMIARVRGKEDPFLKIGETNDRSKAGGSDIVWSLKDINFEFEQGDAIGIIGRNGAGKSTLLKILSRITAPTTGRIGVKGRVASLLEVGTGFHPELSGRENIFLNGAILGMRKAEIKKKFDEIVSFAGIERYVDTPVKRYSSGMYVRLAFAVAAHLDSEILIVDEVLAVGDAEFQKKCLGKMGDISKGEGRTILFVSHNLPAVRQLCNKGLLLKNGCFEMFGQTNETLALYKSFSVGDTSFFNQINSSTINLKKISITSEKRDEELSIEHDLIITTVFDCKEEGKTYAFSYFIYNEEDVLMFEAFVPFAKDKNSEKREYTVDMIIPKFILNSGDYKARIIFGESQKYVLLESDKILSFSIEETIGIQKAAGIIRPNISYTIYK